MTKITKTQKELYDAAWIIWEKSAAFNRNSRGLDRFKQLLKHMEHDTVNEIIIKMHDFIKVRSPFDIYFSQKIAILLIETLDIKKPQRSVFFYCLRSDDYNKESFVKALKTLDEKVAELQPNLTDTASISQM